MTSYLVDAVLLMALAFTSIRVAQMHRELARLRTYQGEFSTIVHETASAFDSVITAAHDSTANLAQLAAVLGTKIDQAHDAIAALDARGMQPPSAVSDGGHAHKPGLTDTERESSPDGAAHASR
ncbi:hypothetical protein [Bradyrhizobium roseum]|uniref:hypothetical protein n=1 Tax=Bradyrhizobium roseum TaxID=3056648 RepID=UPI002613A19D|nr:hypothetical protein [Bradyrhizobium roseus]WKA27311.1 hypothetical protein QUH67_27610 [Bradyrhizobium roseus]